MLLQAVKVEEGIGRRRIRLRSNFNIVFVNVDIKSCMKFKQIIGIGEWKLGILQKIDMNNEEDIMMIVIFTPTVVIVTTATLGTIIRQIKKYAIL